MSSLHWLPLKKCPAVLKSEKRSTNWHQHSRALPGSVQVSVHLAKIPVASECAQAVTVGLGVKSRADALSEATKEVWRVGGGVRVRCHWVGWVSGKMGGWVVEWRPHYALRFGFGSDGKVESCLLFCFVVWKE